MNEYVVPDGAIAYKVEIVDGVVYVRFFDYAGRHIGGYAVSLPIQPEGTAYRATAKHDSVTL